MHNDNKHKFWPSNQLHLNTTLGYNNHIWHNTHTHKYMFNIVGTGIYLLVQIQLI
jgi:hypothetical protein